MPLTQIMTDKEIIRQFGEVLLKDMQKAIPSASGKTRASMEVVFDNDGLGFKIIINQSIGALINGRKPTKDGVKKGNPTLQELIFEWVKTKSIQPKESGMSQLSLSWAISKSIHKKGYEGRPFLFDNALNKNKFDSLSKDLLDKRGTIISSDIIKQIQFK